MIYQYKIAPADKFLTKSLLFLICLILLTSLTGGQQISAQSETAFIRRARTIDTNELGVPNPGGIVYSTNGNTPPRQ